MTRNHRATREDRHFTVKTLQGKVALHDPTSPIPTWSSGSGPRGDFDYPAIHSIVSEVLGSWASFMRGI